MKTKVFSLSYDAMFRAIFSDNKYRISKLIEAILNYYQIDIDITNKELIIKKNELNIDNPKNYKITCDYIIKLDDNHEINIELNRSTYGGLLERNMTYSFKIYYEHFKSGDSYEKFKGYTLLQVNFNKFHNPNGKRINRYYLIDIDDVGNMLSNNYSVINIDIEKCFNLVYNKDNLDDVSELETWGAIIYANYLEDIASILERGKISMSDNEKNDFLDDIKEKSRDKDIYEAVKLEDSIEDRYKYIAAYAREEAIEETTEQVTKEVTKEVTEQVTKEVTKQVTDSIIASLIKNGVSFETISKATGKSIEEIKEIEKNIK